MGRANPPRPVIDHCSLVAIAACGFALIASPLLIRMYPGDFHALDARPENRVFWPAMAAVAIGVTARHQSRFAKLVWPPHLVFMAALAALAGSSVLWAFSPERSSVRFVQQAMIIVSVVLPTLLAGRRSDALWGLFLLFAVSLGLNLVFVLNGSVTTALYSSGLVNIGYEGYFEGKNYLGECAAVGMLLALHQMGQHGWRRLSGAVVLVLAAALVYLSDSKTALGLATASPILAWLTLAVRKATRMSPAIILAAMPVAYFAVSSVSRFDLNHLAYLIYGDSTLTGRTIIWDFAQYEIGRRPVLGWGYQSFWLVPNSPSVSDAPGWVSMMPNAHNGYYDALLEMGYVGLAVLLAFILATLHAVGRVANRDPARAWLVLSLLLFIIFYNYFESLWMRGFEFLWVTFVLVAADVARYWQPVPRAAHRSRLAIPRGLHRPAEAHRSGPQRS